MRDVGVTRYFTISDSDSDYGYYTATPYLSMEGY